MKFYHYKQKKIEITLMRAQNIFYAIAIYLSSLILFLHYYFFFHCELMFQFNHIENRRFNYE